LNNKKTVMKKILYLVALVFIFSCGISKNVNSDPYVGNYNMTILDVDQIGDIFLELSISKTNNGYESSFNFPEGEESIEVISSRVNNGFFEIESTYQQYELFMELEINKNKLSGTFMGMFDIEGKRIK
tara:strand:+ start:186 stop:569 length:384 start_codon:yes stop_codon:yes gene_type:complete